MKFVRPTWLVAATVPVALLMVSCAPAPPPTSTPWIADRCIHAGGLRFEYLGPENSRDNLLIESDPSGASPCDGTGFSATAVRAAPTSTAAEALAACRALLPTLSATNFADEGLDVFPADAWLCNPDSTAPFLTVPRDLLLDAAAPTGTVVDFSATAADDGGPVPVTCDPPSGTTFPVGTTTVECSATDAAGLRTAASFHVEVSSTPLWSPSRCHQGLWGDLWFNGRPGQRDNAAVTSSRDGSCTGVERPATLVQAADEAAALTACDGPGATVAVRSARTWLYGSLPDDAWSCEFETVPPSVSTAPFLLVHADSPSGTDVRFTAAATDNFDGPLPSSCTPASGSVFPVGTTQVVCSSTDRTGNTATVSFPVEVTTGPLWLSGGCYLGYDQPDLIFTGQTNTVGNALEFPGTSGARCGGPAESRTVVSAPTATTPEEALLVCQSVDPATTVAERMRDLYYVAFPADGWRCT